MQNTDREILEKLQALFHKLNISIIYAEEIFKRTQQTNSAVEDPVDKAEVLKLDIARVTAHAQDIEKDIKRWYLEIQDTHTNIVKKIFELTNTENLADLPQELRLAHEQLIEFQMRLEEINAIFPRFHAQLHQGLESVQQLASQVEVEKKEVTELAQQLVSRLNQFIQLQSDVGQILNLGYRLEIISSELSNLAIEVRADREAVQKIKINLENISNTTDDTIWELRAEVELLREHTDHSYREIKYRLQTQLKNQHRLDNWLFYITFSIAFLAVTWILGH
ncbi:hypothetical protein NIES4074_30030 [Cylindrospermum sp. NIES-4074]|nr:hypothetical protein NIES4074_30030 [Cylindrospermum sp. NIES-4074]